MLLAFASSFFVLSNWSRVFCNSCFKLSKFDVADPRPFSLSCTIEYSLFDSFSTKSIFFLSSLHWFSRSQMTNVFSLMMTSFSFCALSSSSCCNVVSLCSNSCCSFLSSFWCSVFSFNTVFSNSFLRLFSRSEALSFELFSSRRYFPSMSFFSSVTFLISY